MENKIQYAKKGVSYCKSIKDAINGLCSMVDIADDTFGETDRITDYKSIFSKVDAWEKQYKNYIEKAGNSK